MREINTLAIAKFLKNWARGIYNRQEAYYGLIENGVSMEDANEILDNPARQSELMAKYGC